MTTKKLLVPYDPAKPDSVSSDFLVPLRDGDGFTLFGMKSKKNVQQGQVIFLGKAIAMNDIFARLIDSGRKIPSVQEATAGIDAYIEMLQNFKIGNIVGVEANAESPVGFSLKLLANMGAVKRVPLP